MQNKIIGIMSAMPEELEGLESLIQNKKKTVIGMRTYYEGEINGIKMVMVFSRWGKVAAATTATTLFLKFGITELIFTGVAGAIQNKLNIGDIVLGTHFIQHDMDARPFIKQFELPLLNISYIESPEEKIDQATSAVQNLLDASYLERLLGNTHMAAFNISQPRLYAGFIASGDKFISTEADRTTLNNTLPAVLCVEMEGAAVAQVCYENKIPFIIFRTISDNANESAPIDFQQFVKNVAQKYSFEFINRLFKGISSENTDQKY